MINAVWDSKSEGNFNADFDCYLAEALLSEGRYFGGSEQTLERYKATTLEQLAKKQEEKLNEFPKLKVLFYDIEQPLAKILWKMEQKGILLDVKQLAKVGEKIDGLLLLTKKKIDKETGGEVNINSPIQLGSFLAEKIGISLGKTKTGRYATNEGELSKFVDQFPILADLLTYRELAKLRSTYVESLISKVDNEGRIHTTYNQVFINTGRLASSNPNLQNIPVSSEIGLEIKSCFIASPGSTLVSFDYSQQELRILAHLADEKALIEAFEKKLDVHNLTASKLFQVSYDEVTKQQRTIAKTINFGIIYGMSSYGMSAGLNIPQEESAKFIEQFYESYPNIKKYYDNYLKNAQIYGFVETLLGRRRYAFENPAKKYIDNNMRRVLMNYPVQGSAADLTRKGMVDIEGKILRKFSDVSLLLTIHDDLVFEIPDTNKPTIKKIISEIEKVLCSVYPLKVPLGVNIKIGKKWGDLQNYENSKA